MEAGQALVTSTNSFNPFKAFYTNIIKKKLLCLFLLKQGRKVAHQSSSAKDSRHALIFWIFYLVFCNQWAYIIH